MHDLWPTNSAASAVGCLAEKERNSERLDEPDGVAGLLHIAGYSLRTNRRTIAGSELPVRKAQFEHLNSRLMQFLQQRQPMIAVDTGVRVEARHSRHADLIGWPPGEPDPPEIRGEHRWDSVGIAESTAGLAAGAVREWWETMGSGQFPRARRLLVAADCGGRDNDRTLTWKSALQAFAGSCGLDIVVCHLPRGTSRFCGLHQRLVGYVEDGRRRRPLPSCVAIVSVIGKTAKDAGLITTVMKPVGGVSREGSRRPADQPGELLRPLELFRRG